MERCIEGMGCIVSEVHPPHQKERALMSTYLLIDGPGVWAYQYQLPRGKTLEIGRATDTDIQLKSDPSVSGHHAILTPLGDDWILRDNDSSNGTFLNDARIQDCVLRHGDTIRVGKTELVFFSPDRETSSQFFDRSRSAFADQEEEI